MIEDVLSAIEENSFFEEPVKLVAVTKTVPVSKIREVYDYGLRDFGENRVQELLDKYAALPSDCKWHLIGSLQTNKVKYIIDKVVLIHSVDRIKLANEIQRQAASRDLVSDVLLQVNTSNEDSKSGVLPEALPALIEGVKALSNVKIRGLMTIAPNTDNESLIRQSFRELAELRNNMQMVFPCIDFSVLSMGMSSDFVMAIKEGSNLVRVGSAIFGRREYK